MQGRSDAGATGAEGGKGAAAGANRRQPSAELPDTSRLLPTLRNQMQGHYYPPVPPQPQPYLSNGQLYGGWRPPPSYHPGPPPYGGAAPPPPFPGGRPQGPGQPPAGAPGQQGPAPAGPSQELTQTATIRNAVNLKKATLEVTPVPGAPTRLAISFTFDASQPCAVTTFVAATEEPAHGCRLASAKQEPAPALYYEKGVRCLCGLSFWCVYRLLRKDWD